MTIQSTRDTYLQLLRESGHRSWKAANKRRGELIDKPRGDLRIGEFEELRKLQQLADAYLRYKAPLPTEQFNALAMMAGIEKRTMRMSKTDEHIRSEHELAESIHRRSQDRMIAELRRDNEALLKDRNVWREAFQRAERLAGLDSVAVDPSSAFPLHELIEALITERNRLRDKLSAARCALATIVESEGIDAGVIYLSWESPTHKETIGGKVCTVYDHECFSELGDALVALARLVKEEAT